eukprot:COSAG05_NODE_3539_length_2003_cov_2.410189_1_plen_90_part_00
MVRVSALSLGTWYRVDAAQPLAYGGCSTSAAEAPAAAAARHSIFMTIFEVYKVDKQVCEPPHTAGSPRMPGESTSPHEMHHTNPKCTLC